MLISIEDLDLSRKFRQRAYVKMAIKKI